MKEPKKADPIHALAWIGRGVSLAELGRYEEALIALRIAIDIDPKSALAHSMVGETLLDLGDLDSAVEEVKKSLNLDENSIDVWALKARVEIEKLDYDSAIVSLKKVISLDIGNPLHLVWWAYANYLKAEFTLESPTQHYKEKILSIITVLEKAENLSQKHINKEIRAYILYFLGCFYYKSKDILQAKERLKECAKIKSKIKGTARQLLENIWHYQIRPPLWRFWLTSPLYCWPKRFISIILVLCISGLVLLHPFIPDYLKVNLNLYAFLISLLILILVFPMLRSIKAKDIEVEIHSPPPFELVLSPATMAEMIGKLEKEPRR